MAKGCLLCLGEAEAELEASASSQQQASGPGLPTVLALASDSFPASGPALVSLLAHGVSLCSHQRCLLRVVGFWLMHTDSQAHRLRREFGLGSASISPLGGHLWAVHQLHIYRSPAPHKPQVVAYSTPNFSLMSWLVSALNRQPVSFDLSIQDSPERD